MDHDTYITTDHGIFKRKKQYRLKNFDYGSDGAYFITICAKDKKHIFGKIQNGQMQLSEIGMIADQYWRNIPDHYPFIKLGEFIIMPNHMHGILIINNPNRNARNLSSTNVCTNGQKSVPIIPNAPHSVQISQNELSSIQNDQDKNPNAGTIHFNKNKGSDYSPILRPQPQSVSIAIRNYKSAVTTWSRKYNLEHDIWQSRFHDHIIWDEKSYKIMENYIKNNPKKWERDGKNYK